MGKYVMQIENRCPFCKGKTGVVTLSKDIEGEHYGYSLYCKKCELEVTPDYKHVLRITSNGEVIKLTTLPKSMWIEKQRKPEKLKAV